MAKRKRLGAANPAAFGAAPEVKGALGMGPGLSRAPIADVASDAAATAALSELTRAMDSARDGGRMVLSLPLDEIRFDHLVRDRIVVDPEEMAVLRASLADRGQQTPVEVMPLPDGGYGLISGWRRCQALAALTEAGTHDGTVLALLRHPGEASEAYLSMVEENEIRVGLSYFERARIAAQAVQQGVFDSEKTALLSLFRSASRAKRSKIRSFLTVVAALDGALRFPGQIGERLGLRLAALLEAQPGFAATLTRALAEAAPETPAAEMAVVTRCLSAAEAAQKQSLTSELETQSTPEADPPSPRPTVKNAYIQQIRPGLRAQWRDDWVSFDGVDMTPQFRERLLRWLRMQQ